MTLRLPLALTAVVFASACSTSLSAQRASVLGAGNSQTSLTPSVQLGIGGGAVLAEPRVDFSYRSGVSRRVDLGVRGGVGVHPGAAVAVVGDVEFTSKFQLTDPANTRFAFSIAPNLGVAGGGLFSPAGSGGGAAITLPISFLFGVGAGEHQFVFGPKVYNALLVGNGVAYLVNLGGSFGMAIQASPGLQVMPEVGFLAPLGGAISAAGATAGAGGGVGLQFGLSFLFGEECTASGTPCQ